ncbi:MAG TPA: peptidoglycan-binding domain-containing protein [Candidatus Paceibacterota bacterium]|nr:peptidoglycan-binding domain-containing protein [Candidatus Paceibacterota bacterium]
MTKAQTLSATFIKTLYVFTVIFAVLLAYAFWAPKAHAAALTETQIQAVSSLLASFGAEQSVLSNVQLALKGASREDILKAMGANMGSTSPRGDMRPTLSNVMGTSSPIMCPMLVRTVGKGANGDDVSNLQAFLQRSGDLKEASTTGYFGQSTEDALKAWQARQGIATSGDRSTTGFGAAGPKTRDALVINCMKMQVEQQQKMRMMEPKRVSSTTPLVPPPPKQKDSDVVSLINSIKQVSGLISLGAASVFEGYTSLFEQ